MYYSWLYILTGYVLQLTVDPDWMFESLLSILIGYIFTVDYGSWFDNVLHWHEATKSLPNGSIHVMTYENLHTVQNYVLDGLQQ